MNNDFTAQAETVWCAERLNSTDDDLSLATLFSPSNERDAVHAISALYVELERITNESIDLNVARLKLAWWREEVGQLATGSAEHPVTRLLSRNEVIPPVTNLLDLITGAELRLLQGQITDLATVRLAGERVGPPLAKSLASLSGESPTWAAELGRAIALSRYLPQVSQAKERMEGKDEVLRLLVAHTPPAKTPGFIEALRVLVTLAWKQSVSMDKRSVISFAPSSRVIASWRAARGHLPHKLKKMGSTL